MKKSEIKKQILEKISIMEQNTFLFPLSWSEKTDMEDYSWSYKTYNSGSKGVSRYHNIEIHNGNDKILDINFRNSNIEIIQNLDLKTVTYLDVLKYVSIIFDEKHSFKNHSEGKRKIRNSINEKKQLVKNTLKEIELLEQRLLDFKELS